MDKKNFIASTIIIGALVGISIFFLNERGFLDPIKDYLLPHETLDCSNYTEIKLKDIYAEKETNLINAKEKYKNQTFIFKGKISYLDYSEVLDSYSFTVEDGEYEADVTINKSQIDKLKQYSTDSKISFCGTITDVDPIVGGLDINNATIIE